MITLGSFVDSEEKTLKLLLQAKVVNFSRDGMRATHRTIGQMRMSKNWKVAAQIVSADKVKVAINTCLELKVWEG